MSYGSFFSEIQIPVKMVKIREFNVIPYPDCARRAGLVSSQNRSQVLLMRQLPYVSSTSSRTEEPRFFLKIITHVMTIRFFYVKVDTQRCIDGRVGSRTGLRLVPLRQPLKRTTGIRGAITLPHSSLASSLDFQNDFTGILIFDVRDIAVFHPQRLVRSQARVRHEHDEVV